MPEPIKCLNCGNTYELRCPYCRQLQEENQAWNQAWNLALTTALREIHGYVRGAPTEEIHQVLQSVEDSITALLKLK